MTEARKFFDIPHDKRIQKRFKLPYWPLKEIIPILERLFYGKCAYCENKVQDISWGNVENHRPKLNTVDLEGNIFPDHYWWLRYEWENLYYVCQKCNLMKGTRFPIRGKRVEVDGKLEDENPLLLDPCVDDPDKHILFSEDGRVIGRTERGTVTIQVLNLNREELIKARKRELVLFRKKVTTISNEGILEEFIQPTQTFVGMKRQLLSQFLESPQMYRHIDIPIKVSIEEIKNYTNKFETYQSSKDIYSLEDDRNIERYFQQTRLIESIKIRNFKIIENFEIDLSKGYRENTPWLMLLGENGTGKSSILQAVALALIGKKYLQELNITPSDVLRYGSKEGFVQIFLSGIEEPIELKFQKKRSFFEMNQPDPKVLILGYGSTRLLPKDKDKTRRGIGYANIDNLFNPFVPLRDAISWLINSEEEQFQAVASSLKILLSLSDQDELVRAIDNKVGLKFYDTIIPIDQLSDGYQSILALCIDMMAVFFDQWKSMEIAEGIVLLDEIGAYIHPRWKMQIVKSLRQVFPRIQFLVTTHDPLCLRSLEKGEIHLLHKDISNKLHIEQIDVPPGFRSDQILTGEWFGLPTTLDEDTLNLIKEHQRLLINKQTTQVKSRKEEVEKTLRKRLRGYGETALERLALGVAAEIMVKDQRDLGPRDRKELRKKILDRVEELKEG